MSDDLTFRIIADFAQASAAFNETGQNVETLKRKLEELNNSEADPKIKAEASDFTAKLLKSNADLDKLNDKAAHPTIDLEIAAEKAKYDKIILDLDTLQKKRVTPEVELLDKATAQAERLEAKLDELRAKPVNIDTDLEITKLEAKRDRVNENIRQLSALVANPEADLQIETLKIKADQSEERLRQLSNQRIAPEVQLQIAKAEADAAKLQAELAAFVDKHVTIDVDTTKANTDIGKFATDMEAKISAAIKALPKIEITADSTLAEQKIALIRAKLDELKDKRIGIDITKEQFDAQMAVIMAELDVLTRDRNIPIKADSASALSELKKIGDEGDNLLKKFQNLNLGSALAAGISASIIPALQSIGELSGALGLIPAVAAAAGTGIATVAVGVQGMDTALKAAAASQKANTAAVQADATAQQASATAVQAGTAAHITNTTAIQAAITQGAAHIANLKAQQAAGQNVTTSLASANAAQASLTAQLKTAQAANTSNTGAVTAYTSAQKNATSAASQAQSAHQAAAKAADAQAAAMKDLAPAAQGVVSAILQLQPAFTSLRMDVQQHLFEGLKQAILDTASSALPVLKTGLDQMGTSINTAVKDVAAFIQQQSSVSAWKEIFSNISTAATALAGAIKPILQIITDVTQVGSQFLPGLATGFANAAQAAADFVSHAKETGQLAQWIQTGITAMGQLWQIIKNVVAIIAQLTASPGFGPSFLQSIEAVTTAIRWLLTNIPALTQLVTAFVDAWVVAKIVQGITGLVTTVSGLGTTIDGLVLKLAALTGGETAAGAAATGVAAGFTGMLGPLAALGLAIGVLVTHWDVVSAGFQQMGILALSAANDIVGAAKAIGDAATLNFGAAQRALDETNARHKELMTEFSNLNGFNSATAGATGLTTALGGTTTALGTQAGAAASTASAYDSLKQALLGVTTSVTANGTAVNANTTAGQANVAAVTAAINAAKAEEQAYAASGASISQQTALHNSNVLAIQKVTTNLGINSGSVASLISTYAAGNPKLKLTPTLDPSGVASGVKIAQNLANSLKPPPPIPFKGDVSDIQAKSGQAKTAAQPPPQPAPTQFKGDASGVTASSGQAKTAATSVPQPPTTVFLGNPSGAVNAANQVHESVISVFPSWLTTFLGLPDQLNSTVNNVIGLIQSVDKAWLTSFFGDSTNLAGTTTQSNSLIDSVKSTHGSAFTGDPSGLNAAVATSVAGIATVNPAPPTVVFTADITDITSKTTDATTQINAVPTTHPTTLTADDTDVLAKDAAVIASLNSIPDHDVKITATDNATATINNIVNSLNTLQDKTITITTVYRTVNAAGGLIATAGMANGGLVMPMANGGDLSPNMSGSSAKIIPPNTWRVIGDRMIDDEAFIPINNSSSSTAILAETAQRKGYALAPMAGGGYNQRGDDEDMWGWLFGRHHGHHGGGGGPTPPPVPAPIPDNWGGSGAYEVALQAGYATTTGSTGVGGTEAVTRPVSRYTNTGQYSPATPNLPPAGSGGGSTPPPITCHIHFDNPGGNKIVDALFNEFRNSIRVQGGNVQMVLGKN